MGKLNKTAPKIFVAGPIYSTKFYGDGDIEQYDIILKPNGTQRMTRHGPKTLENEIPDDLRLIDHLYEMIYLKRSVVFPGLVYHGLNVEKCLQYHYEKYDGDKVYFLDTTEEKLTEKPYNKLIASILSESIAQRIKNWCYEKRQLLNKDQGQSELVGDCKLTARQLLFIDYYKVISRIRLHPTSPEEYGKPGTQRYKKYYSVFGTKEKFKPANQEDLNTIIPLLKEYPLAHKAAVNDLDKLQ